MNVDKAMEIINQIASKLGVAAEYIAPELARLKITEGIVGIATSIIVSALVYMAIAKTLKYLRHLSDDDNRSWVDKSDMQIGCMMLIGFLSIVGVFAAFAFFDGISELSGWITSPTAKSIEYVMRALRQQG